MKLKKLNPQGVKILKMAHIFFAFSWIVGALALCTLLFATQPQSGDELYMRSQALKILDDWFIICGALGSLFTGLIYSAFTSWGFFKHRWVSVKWVLTIAQILFGTFVLGPCINGNLEISKTLRAAALSDPTFIENIRITQIGGTAQACVLFCYIVISVQKPWKNRLFKTDR